MEDNDYDFKMEWPEEFAEYANLPPISDEALNGIIAAITPVMRRIRIKRRIKTALGAGTTVLAIGICIFTGINVIDQHKELVVPAAGIVRQMEARPTQNKRESRNTVSSGAPISLGMHINPVRLTAGLSLKSGKQNNSDGKYGSAHRDDELRAYAGTHRHEYRTQQNRIGNAEDVTGPTNQAWTESVEVFREATLPAIKLEEATRAAEQSLPK